MLVAAEVATFVEKSIRVFSSEPVLPPDRVFWSINPVGITLGLVPVELFKGWLVECWVTGSVTCTLSGCVVGVRNMASALVFKALATYSSLPYFHLNKRMYLLISYKSSILPLTPLF